MKGPFKVEIAPGKQWVGVVDSRGTVIAAARGTTMRALSANGRRIAAALNRDEARKSECHVIGKLDAKAGSALMKVVRSEYAKLPKRRPALKARTP